MVISKNPGSDLLTLIYDSVLEFLILTELGNPWETGSNTDHQFCYLWLSVHICLEIKCSFCLKFGILKQRNYDVTKHPGDLTR